LENPITPPSLWNLFRENNLSGNSRTRAGGMILGNKKPIPDEGDGSFEKS
jgi:hypothetical protein